MSDKAWDEKVAELLAAKSDAEIEAWSNGILNTPPEDRAEMCAEDPSVLDVPAEHIRRLKARLAAAPSGEPDALTRDPSRLIAAAIAWRNGESCRCGPNGMPVDHTDDCPANKLDNELFDATWDYERAAAGRAAEGPR